MARIVTKGAKLQVTISAALTDIAQLISFTEPTSENQVEVTATIDDSIGVTKSNTGYVDTSDLSAELFFDKASATHEFITDTIQLGAASFPIACKIIGSDSTEDTFNIVGLSISKSFPERGFQRATIGMKLTGQITYAT